jgi:hypothetical protein
VSPPSMLTDLLLARMAFTGLILGWIPGSMSALVWLLKNSFSAQTASNPVTENVYPVRENRLWGILAR